MKQNTSKLVKNRCPQGGYPRTVRLKQWARAMAQGKGPNAELCRLWLTNKGLVWE